MSNDRTSQTPVQMSLLEDSPASHSPTQESSAPGTTPDISGRKCLDLSGNAGPLGLLEKTLLGSCDWAWTKYSLTWKAKATPQGRLIFQLARLAPRTSGSDSGLLHTPTAKANQTSPSMVEKGRGNWVAGMWPTPRTTGLDGGSNSRKAAKERGMWPTPQSADYKNMDTANQKMLSSEVKLWPTPRASGEESLNTKSIRSNTGLPLSAAVQMWPTPRASEWKGVGPLGSKSHRYRLDRHYLDATVQEEEKTTGKLNPQWVAWLMGYPTEYLSCVPWETRSSRRSRKK